MTWPPNPPASSDHEQYDRARDELAVADPYEQDFEPVYTHGPVLPPDVAARPLAAMPPSRIMDSAAGCSKSARTPGPDAPPGGRGFADHLDVNARAMPGGGA